MKKEHLNQIQSYFDKLKNTLDNVDKEEVAKFVELLEEARANKKQIFIFGNGGASTTAAHFASDLNKPVDPNFPNRFKIICLNDNIPTMLAYANDISFDDIFKEQLKNLVQEGDLVIGMSGSGNSKNIVKAIEYANSVNAKTIGITGYDGGKLKKVSDYSVNANINDMQISQDYHLILVHIAMQIIFEM